MRTNPPDPGPEAVPEQQHDWFSTGVAWSARHSGEEYREERRCRYCGETALFSPQHPLRRDACPARIRKTGAQ